VSSSRAGKDIRTTANRLWPFVVFVLLTACGARGAQPTPTPFPTPVVPEKPTYTVQRGPVVKTVEFRGRVSPVTEEELFFEVQLPHGYDEGSIIVPHVHWVPTGAAASGDVRWGLEYTWANIGGSFGTTNSVGVTDTAGSQYDHQIASFGDISGSGKTISSVILCRLYRDPDHEDDDYGDDAAVVSIDIHVLHDSLGSDEETDKTDQG